MAFWFLGFLAYRGSEGFEIGPAYLRFACCNVGVVRKTSARIIPDVNSGNGQYTLNRPPAPLIEEDTKTPRLDRFMKRRKD